MFWLKQTTVTAFHEDLGGCALECVWKWVVAVQQSSPDSWKNELIEWWKWRQTNTLRIRVNWPTPFYCFPDLVFPVLPVFGYFLCFSTFFNVFSTFFQRFLCLSVLLCPVNSFDDSAHVSDYYIGNLQAVTSNILQILKWRTLFLSPLDRAVKRQCRVFKLNDWIVVQVCVCATVAARFFQCFRPNKNTLACNWYRTTRKNYKLISGFFFFFKNGGEIA